MGDFRAYIVFWSLLAIWVIIEIFFMATKRFRLIEFINCLTLVGGSQIIDNLLGHQLHLYYYLDREYSVVYSVLYSLTIYPCSAIVYSWLFPKKSTLLNLGLYSLAWTVFYILLEMFIIEKFHVIVYTGWRVIPHSLLFYIIGFPLYAWYYTVISSKAKHKK